MILVVGFIIIMILSLHPQWRRTTETVRAPQIPRYFQPLTPSDEDYDSSKMMFQGMPPAFKTRVSIMYERYKQFSQFNSDIVNLTLLSSGFLLPKVLSTFPHEWTANMIKDALLFNLNLAVKLNKYGLVLSDPGLRGTLFNFTHPLFANPFSILPASNNTPGGRIFQNALQAFVQLAEGKTSKARQILREEYLSPKANQIEDDRWGILKDYQNQGDSIHSWTLLNKTVSSIRVGTNPHPNSYPSKYYDNKNENFTFDPSPSWLGKQKSLYEIFLVNKPKTVLDLGCNTGWFSILAERMGSNVIAIDADEAVIDDLYLYSKRNKLNILPLVLSFQDLEKPDSGSEYRHTTPIQRVRSEMTICLALIHHLILVYHMTAEQVMHTLAASTTKLLVLEYPNTQDYTITTHWKQTSRPPLEEYSIEAILREGWKYFRKVTVYPSNPESRTLFVFEK